MFHTLTSVIPGTQGSDKMFHTLLSFLTYGSEKKFHTLIPGTKGSDKMFHTLLSFLAHREVTKCFTHFCHSWHTAVTKCFTHLLLSFLAHRAATKCFTVYFMTLLQCLMPGFGVCWQLALLFLSSLSSQHCHILSQSSIG